MDNIGSIKKMVIPKITKTTTLSKLISTEKAYLPPLLGLDYDFVWCNYYIIGSHSDWLYHGSHVYGFS